MVGRAAGDDDNLPDSAQQSVVQPGGAQIDLIILYQRVQGIAGSLGLLMNFLHHKVLIACLFGSFGIPIDVCVGLFNRLTVDIEKRYRAFAQPRNFQIADVINITGVLQDRGHVGGQISLALAHGQDHGAILAGGVDFARRVGKQHGQGIGAAHTRHGAGQRVHRPQGVFARVIVNQLNHDFGIGLGMKGVACVG